jgi:hypothetical protein
MSYFPSIPAANDDPSVSQGQIQTNFGTLNSAFNLNHVPLGTGTGQAGKHNFVEMPIQGSTPTTIAGEGSAYTLTETGSQLAYVADANTTDVYQLTRTIHGSYALFADNTNYQPLSAPKPSVNGGWTFLPGGLLLQYGQATDSHLNTNNQIFFPVPFTSFISSVTLGPIRNNTSDKTISILTGSIGLTSFSLELSSSDRPTGVCWMAIGV